MSFKDRTIHARPGTLHPQPEMHQYCPLRLTMLFSRQSLLEKLVDYALWVSWLLRAWPRLATSVTPFDACRCSWHSKGQGRRLGVAGVVRAVPDPLLPLGLDFLTFLAATVLVIPVFKSVKASPVLGFLFSGLVLGQLGYALHLTGFPSRGHWHGAHA